MTTKDEPKKLPPKMEVPVLAIRNAVVFPSMVTSINVGRPKSLKAITAASNGSKYLGIFTQKDGKDEDPNPATDLHQIGTLVRIMKVVIRNENKYHIIVQGVGRIHAKDWTLDDPFLQASCETYSDPPNSDPDLKKKANNLKQLTHKLILMNPGVPDDADFLIQTFNSPTLLADVVASNLPLAVHEKQTILESWDPLDRIDIVITLVEREISSMKVAMKMKNARSRCQRMVGGWTF